MCTGLEVALLAGSAASAVSTLTAKKPEMPKAPEMQKPPEQAKTPERDPFKMGNQKNAAAQGPASTMLTGPAGVSSSGLSLGRSSLYDAEKSKLGA